MCHDIQKNYSAIVVILLIFYFILEKSIWLQSYVTVTGQKWLLRDKSRMYTFEICENILYLRLKLWFVCQSRKFRRWRLSEVAEEIFLFDVRSRLARSKGVKIGEGRKQVDLRWSRILKWETFLLQFNVLFWCIVQKCYFQLCKLTSASFPRYDRYRVFNNVVFSGI